MKPPRISRPRRILVSQLRRLGDVVLTTPLLEDLRRAFPDATVDFLVGDRAAPLLDHHPLVHERLIFDRAHPVRMWRAVRARRYDWIVDPQSSPRTAPLALLSGAPVRAGFGVRGWGWVYTHRLPRSGRTVEYVARERQRLLEMLGVAVARPRTKLVLTDEERAAGRRRLEAQRQGPPAAAVAIVLSSGDAKREWPVDHFAALASALALDGLQPVLLETPGDAERVARVRAASSALLHMSVPGLRDFMGTLAACEVLVSADTGPAHIATALQVPRVTIYGPEPPAAWAPLDDPRVIALRAASALTSDVTPAQVVEGVRTMLARGAPRA